MTDGDRPEGFELFRGLLERRRKLGDPFAVAYDLAFAALPEGVTLKMVRRDVDTRRDGGLSAIEQTRSEWERAYNREPPAPRPKPPSMDEWLQRFPIAPNPNTASVSQSGRLDLGNENGGKRGTRSNRKRAAKSAVRA